MLHSFNNFFEFNLKIKQQISGAAIETKIAPPYAWIFIDKLETNFLTTLNFKPFVWLRYTDDIFFFWTHGEEKLQDFLNCLNGFPPNLKFTYEHSIERINFSYVTVRKEIDEFVADLYCKATDCHQYLHYDSCHPDHMKKSNVYSQGLRIKGLYSGGHKWQSREELLRPKGMNEKNVGIPFVVIYHQHLKNISKIIKKHIKNLYTDPDVRSVFTPLPFVSFRSVRNLKSHYLQ